MQSPIFGPSQLPPLPPPTLYEHWVLDAPIPLALSIAALGIIVFGVLRRTPSAKRIGIPVLALGLVLAGAVYALGAMTTTDRERLQARSAQLVEAVASSDRDQLERLLDEDVRLKSMFVTQTGKANLISIIETRSRNIVQSAETKEVRAGLYGPQSAKTQVRVRVDGDMVPPASWWALDWKRPTPDSDDWVVFHIEPIWIQGFPNPAGTN